MKNLILFFLFLAGIIPALGQYNLKQGRVHKEFSAYGRNGYTDSLKLNQILPDSFTALFTHSFQGFQSYPNNRMELKCDSVSGTIWYKRLDRLGNVQGFKKLYQFPNNRKWFGFSSPWPSHDSIIAKITNSFSIVVNSKTYEVIDLDIILGYDTTRTGLFRTKDRWVKGVGSISNQGGFFHLYNYFGILGPMDSLRTRVLCVSNPLDPTDFQFVNPVYNTCSLTITGIGGSVNAKVMTAYPNPTTGRLRLRGLKETEAVNLRLFNNQGQEVWKGSPSTEGEIDISNLPTGLYHLEALNAQGQRWSTRVVRE